MDWADEIAEKLCLDESGDHPRLPGMDEIATALRKAKEDALEAAAKVVPEDYRAAILALKDLQND